MPFGTTWTIAPDGQLQVGTTGLNGRNDLVDAVSQVTGAAATIFQGDTRIATNVKNQDGSRGIGTKLAPGPAYDTVLRDGQTYRGSVTILGAPYLAIYEPIRDVNNQTVGILFAGVPLGAAQAFMTLITAQAVVGAAIIALLAGLGYFWILRATIRPVTDLAEVMRQVADGALESPVPSINRTDQIGEMARALLMLREASTRARLLDQQAEAARVRFDADKRAVLTGMAERIEAETTTALRDVASRSYRHDSDSRRNDRVGRADRRSSPKCCDLVRTGDHQCADHGQRG